MNVETTLDNLREIVARKAAEARARLEAESRERELKDRLQRVETLHRLLEKVGITPPPDLQDESLLLPGEPAILLRAHNSGYSYSPDLVAVALCPACTKFAGMYHYIRSISDLAPLFAGETDATCSECRRAASPPPSSPPPSLEERLRELLVELLGDRLVDLP